MYRSKVLRLPPNIYLENHAITNIFPGYFSDWDQYEFVGTLSWKFFEKTHIKPALIPKIMASVNAQEIDAIGFFYVGFNMTLFELTDPHHPKFSQIWTELLHSFGNRFTTEQITKCCKQSFFSNYWIAKTSLVKELCLFHKEIYDLMQTLPSIQDDLWSDSKYISCGSNMKGTPIQEIFNRSYYTYHPFILERLAPFYFEARNARIGQAKLLLQNFRK